MLWVTDPQVAVIPIVQAVRLQDFSGFGVNTVGELAHNCQGFPDLFTKPPGAMLSGEYMKNL